MPGKTSDVHDPSTENDLNSSSQKLRVVLSTVAVTAVFFGIIVALHHAGFHSRMIYDSVGLIAENVSIFARCNVFEVLSIFPTRPLPMLTLFFNYLWTGMDPFFFRICNAMILAAAGTALMFLIILIFEQQHLNFPGTKRQKQAAGFLLALWFVIHPLQILSVLYIWQRQAIFACFFVFTATAVYIASRSGKLRGSFTPNFLTSLLFLAGILSKENSIILPVVLLSSEWILFRQSFKSLIFRTGVIGIMTIPPVIIYFFLTHSLYGPDAIHAQGTWDQLKQYYVQGNIPLTYVILTQCRIVFLHLSAILAPLWSGIQLTTAESFSHSLFNPPTTIAAVIGITAFIALALRLVKRQPVTAFGILFFFIALLPESLLIPQYLFCGYRAILPMAGLLIAIGPFLLNVAASPKKPAKVITVLLVLAALGTSAMMTLIQARNWNPLHIWQQAYNRLPPFSANVERTPYLDILGSYGSELIHAGRYDEAIQVLNRAVSIDSLPNTFKKTLALEHVGQAQIKKGDLAAAIESFRQAVQSDPTSAQSLNFLGDALVQQGNLDEGSALLRKAADLNPRSPLIRFNLGNVLIKKGRLSDAIQQYQEASRLDPSSTAIHTSLAVALEKSGNLPAALLNYEKTVKLKPQSPQYQFNLAKALMQTGNFTGAIAHYHTAVELNPTFGEAHANLGSLLLRIGRPLEAAISLKQALDLLTDNPQLIYQYGLALQNSGRNVEALEQFRKVLSIKADHAGALKALGNLK